MFRLYRNFAFLLLLAYSALAAVLTHPLVWHLTTRVPHDLADPLLSTVILWWNAHQLPLTAGWWDTPFFYPATGAVTFSDHRLGESLLASPLQWAGLGPLTAYNVTLLATFPLCALAAHWLAYTLTERHDASVLAGLAYGFSPYRFAHIEHLELLAAFGMPLALAALHRYWRDRRVTWLAVFGAALLLQALSCSYYFVFFLVMLALWILWFVRGDDLAALIRIAVVVAIVAAVISPIAVTYLDAHERYGLARHRDEIVSFSADIASVATASPLSTFWGWTSGVLQPERQLFPGLTIVLVVAIAVLGAMASDRPRLKRNRAAIGLITAGGLLALAGRSAWRRGRRQAGTVSASARFGPLSLAFYALVASVLASSWVRGAYRRRSAFAFYVLAAAALFVFSLGPDPAFLGRPIMVEAPYAWLMRFSVFREHIRVPARFAMPAILALSVAGACAFERLTKRRRSVALASALIAGVIADASISGLPLLAAPRAWPSQVHTAGVSAFVELPLGETIPDAAAMYRSMLSGLPTVNGYSGYVPPHYEVLRLALDEFDESALEALADQGRLLVVLDRTWPASTEWLRRLRANPNARETWADSQSAWFTLSGRPSTSSRCTVPALPIVEVRDRAGFAELAAVQDGDDQTFWMSAAGQRSGDALILDLGRLEQPCSVQVTLGTHVAAFPRMLSVATSPDGSAWQTSFTGRLGGRAVAASIARPRGARLDFPLPNTPARFIRLQIEADQPRTSWIVTELAVTGRGP